MIRHIITKLLILLVATTGCVQTFAMSSSQVRDVYIKLVKANGIHQVPKLIFSKSSEVNAETNGWQIKVNTGMLRNFRSPHEVALVLGHELAHGTLRHNGSTIRNEYAADKLGARYARNTGYNICIGAKVLKRFGNKASKTHPAGTDRYKRLGCS